MPRIEIRIPKDPNKPRTVKVEGVLGGSCQDLTKGIQAALGTTVSDEPTAEFHMEQTQNDDQILEQGG